jgi:hypothetical protein
LNANLTRSAGSSMRAKASATSASRSSLRRRFAALVAERDPHLRQRVLGLAGALRGLGGTAGEALQGHVQRLLLDARRLGGEPQLLQRLNTDADLVGRLADGIGR